MQTVGPYRLVAALNSCEVGGIWSGVDEAGRSVTVAVLNERASADQRWRDAFAAAADTLAEAGVDQLPIVASDHRTAAPWVACAAERGAGAAQIFTALGQRLQPIQQPAPQPVSAQPVSAQPVSAQPVSAPPAGAQPVSAQPVSAQPVSGEPVGSAARQAKPGVQRSGQGTSQGTSQGNGRAVAGGMSAATAAAVDEPTALLPHQAVPQVGPAGAGRPGPWQAPPRADRAGRVRPQPEQLYRPDQHRPDQPWGDQHRTEPAPQHRTEPAPQRRPVDGPSSGAPVTTFPVERTDPFPVPHPDAYADHPTSGHPASGPPISGVPLSPYPSRVFGQPDPVPAKRRRTGLLIALVAVAALLVGAGGAAAVLTATRDDPAPAPTANAPVALDLALPQAAPTQPGVEPPQGGGWPAGWPTFTSAESTRPMNSLDGLGFSFQVPPGWNCTRQQKTSGFVRYRCGSGEERGAGGDVIVRHCERPCTEDRRAELRQLEEAWGLRWTKSGPFVTWAETTEIGGKRRYGLVYVGFWRSDPNDAIDRELVLRLTAPLGDSDDIKKVANSVRDKTFTL